MKDIVMMEILVVVMVVILLVVLKKDGFVLEVTKLLQLFVVNVRLIIENSAKSQIPADEKHAMMASTYQRIN